MPVRVRASTDLGLNVVILEGVVTAQEFETLVGPLLDNPEYSLMPMTLVDMMAAVRGDAPANMISRQAQRAAHNVDKKIDGHPRMALAAKADEFYGLGRMYQMLREGSPVEIAVFRSLEEAERWLDLPDDYDARLSDVV